MTYQEAIKIMKSDLGECSICDYGGRGADPISCIMEDCPNAIACRMAINSMEKMEES